ncbi:hypothetical protein VKT23_006919 [Stygiomarasmius scandens]|uniref:Uncharacterized protein n=1 Tax=Marasmiellus scandens TaxID=2682957 RepID=A0ABR1JNR4_9AGAR
MLDSSPVTLPDIPRRPLKRSASTASLPTPPRTQHRRKKNGRRSRSTRSSDEDSEADSPANRSTDEEDDAPRRNNKRRRISNVQEDEDSFWKGGSQTDKTQPGTSHPDSARSKTLSAPATVAVEEDDEQVPFLFRRKLNQSTTGVAPVSPPPSHRRPRAAKVAVAVIPPAIEEEKQVSPAVTVASTPPATPQAQISKGAFMRDSPNNPFLSSPVDDDELDVAQSASPSPSQRERETMTFVFRGVKKTFPNPYYDREKKRAKSPDPRSLLPPEHEDYTPDLRGAPRVLWPRRKKAALGRPDPTSPTTAAGKRKKTAGKNKARTLLDSDDELEGCGSDDDSKPMKPKKLFDAPKIS